MNHAFNQSPEDKGVVQNSLEFTNGDDFRGVENVGGLQFEEYTQGGLGRHLGIFSTTFLM